MSSVRERLDKIMGKIQRPNFLENKGLGNEIGFYIFDYDPGDELLVREHVAYLKGALNHETSGRKVIEFDLYQMMLDLLNREGVLADLPQIENEQGSKYLLEALRDLASPEVYVGQIAERAAGYDIIFLTGIGKVWPIVRSHNILNNLHPIKKAGQPPTDVILFNIDSKSDYGTAGNKDAILKVFLKVFYEMQGFYGSKPWIADMESQLTREGKYEEFKKVIHEKAGDTWENRRRRVLFDKDLIVQTLMEVRKSSKDAVLDWFNMKDNNFTLSIEEFALMVKAYLEEKGRDHHIVFLVDEIGQYIGENTQMMLDLQTIVEELGIKCRGKAWVIVTSQEDIDAVTKVKGRDFSKIQGRFNTRINLSSANVDEVIKKRILDKTPPAKDTLGLLYDESDAKLRNTISFSGTAEMKNFADKTDFIEVYPFIPYQFNLLQKVFAGIRKHGSSGKHLAEGERSLLSAFQESAQAYREKYLGTLVPFFLFYHSIETFLDGSIRRVIDQARENSKLEPEDIDVLKLLFMIKYVKEIPSKLENIICYDLMFPEASRVLALRGADIIIHSTNLPVGSESFIHTLLPARALENRVFMLASSRIGTERGFSFIGGSAMVDPFGRFLARAGSEQEEIIYADIKVEKARRKHTAVRPGEYEFDLFNDRRPEFYGDIYMSSGRLLK